VAPNKFLAKLASDLNKPDGLTEVPFEREGIVAFLRPLDVGRLWGVGRVMRGKLASAGLLRIGDLQRVPPADFERLVGVQAARHLRGLAFGDDARDVAPASGRRGLSREHTFARDCADPEEVRRTLIALVADVGRRLREARSYAGLARLKLRWPDFQTITRQKTFDVPVCDDTSLREAALELLQVSAAPRAVRLVGFGVGSLSGRRTYQPTLFDGRDPEVQRREALSRALDGLHARTGVGPVRSAAALPVDAPPAQNSSAKRAGNSSTFRER
jgi:DNA polymerase-4